MSAVRSPARRMRRRRACVAATGLCIGIAVAACGAADEPARDDESSPIAPAGPPRAPQPLPGSADFALASARLDQAHADLASGRDADGESLGLTWMAFDGGRDEIFAAVYGAGGWQTPQRLSEEPGVYFPPRIVADPAGGFFVVWAARADGGYSLFGRALREGGLGALERLTDGAGIDGEPVLAASGDTLWLAWESFRDGGFDVWARRRSGGAWGDAIRITDDPRSDLQPSLGVDANGTAWVAFVSWRDGEYTSGNYEIYAAPLPSTASPGDPRPVPVRLSRSPHVDMFPELFAVGSELCALWTEAYFPERRIEALRTVAYNFWKDKVFQLACREGEGWSAPRGIRVLRRLKHAPVPDDRATPIAAAVGTPGARPEVWVLYGRLESRETMDRSWAMALTRLAAGEISAPVDLSLGATGAGGRLGAAWMNGWLWTAETIVHERGRTTGGSPTWVRIRSIDPKALPRREPAPPIEAEPRDAPASTIRVGPDERGVGHRITHGGSTWQAYFGNLHNHSDFSRDGRGFNGSAVQAFRAVYDVATLDFAALTDHVEWLLPTDWWEIRKVTDLWNRPDDFVTLTSYEWTSLAYGHRNLVFPDAAIESRDLRFDATGATPDDLWRFLGERPAVTIPHHPSHGIDLPMDWSYRNDRFQRLVEIFQYRGSYEYDGAAYQRRDLRPKFYDGHGVRDALALGHRLGIIASPDHGGGMGLAAVWAETLTRESIFEALHARRTFGTTGAKMELFLSVAGEPQGSEVRGARAPVSVTASVRGTAPGLDLVLVSDGSEVKRWRFDGDQASIEWRDERPLVAVRYYYLRAQQSDGHIGWTSPVWVSKDD